jgi:hypothetical protein
VVINNRKYFAFSYYKQVGPDYLSYCKQTFVSTSHQVGVNPSDWSCFVGVKANDNQEVKIKRSNLGYKLLEM